MKSKNDKQIAFLVEKLMAKSDLESPSVDFTAKVMSEVLIAENSKTSVYKPVISKRGWFTIFAGVIALFAFLLLNTQSEASTINFDFSIFSFDKLLASFFRLHISSLMSNVLLTAAIMLFIQIFLLKSYLNKRFEK